MGTSDKSDDETRVWSGKFWVGVETPDEGRVIDTVIKRRFPATYPLLNECLEEADPEDIVYRNPLEYSDVAAEAIAQLAWQRACVAESDRLGAVAAHKPLAVFPAT